MKNNNTSNANHLPSHKNKPSFSSETGYSKRRVAEEDDTVSDGILRHGRNDIEEELDRLDTYREYMRENHRIDANDF